MASCDNWLLEPPYAAEDACLETMLTLGHDLHGLEPLQELSGEKMAYVLAELSDEPNAHCELTIHFPLKSCLMSCSKVKQTLKSTLLVEQMTQNLHVNAERKRLPS